MPDGNTRARGYTIIVTRKREQVLAPGQLSLATRASFFAVGPMGAHLDKPVVEKETETATGNGMRFGTSGMQVR